MFSCLMGGRFSVKCKHAVKCIRLRINAIGKKKQATVRVLKQDVADLLDAGHDSNAFGRMDALIAEKNQMDCYEMIEKFCAFILNQLPSLRRQRECPQGALGAVATLIYAAARFPDLPELCDLRHIFVERYGGHMESFVNAEFIDKIQRKSFSKEKKLQVMQSIADEFSVSWDSWAFEHKPSVPPAIKYEQPKEVEPLHSANDVTPLEEIKSRKEILPKENYEPTPIIVAQRRVQTELKDSHMISACNTGQSHATVKKIRKATTNEVENMEPHQVNTALHSYENPKNNQKGNYGNDEPKGPSYNNTSKVQEKLDQCGPVKQEVYMMKSWNEKTTVIPHYKSNWSRNYSQVMEKSTTGLGYDRSQRHQEWLGHTERERRAFGLVNDKVVATNVTPPYVKSKTNDFSVNDDRTIQKPCTVSHDKPHDNYNKQEDEIFGDNMSSLQMKSQSLAVTEANDRGIHEERNRSQTLRHRRYTSRQSSGVIGEYYGEEKTRTRHPRETVDDEMDNPIRHTSRWSPGSNGEYHRELFNDEMDNQRQHEYSHCAGKNGGYRDGRKTRTRYPMEPIYDEMDNQRRHTSKEKAGISGEYYDEKNTGTRNLRELADDAIGNRARHTRRRSASKNGEYYDDESTRARSPSESIYDDMDNRRRHTRRRSASNNSEYYDDRKTRARSLREPIYDDIDNQRRHTRRQSASNNGEYCHEEKTRAKSPVESIHDDMDNRRRHTRRRSASNNSEHYDDRKTRARSLREPVYDEMDNQKRHKSRRSASNNSEYYDEGKIRATSPRELIYNEMDNRRRHTSRQITGNSVKYYGEGKARGRSPRKVIYDEMGNAIDYGKLMPGTSIGSGRNGGRPSAPAPIYDEGYDDDDDMVIDTLLIQYSKRGTSNERIQKERRSGTPLRDYVLESDMGYHGNGTLIQPGTRVAAHPPKRTLSLPPEAVHSSEVSKVPTRSASMQPVSLSPNCRRAHPRLPEYDDLAAHFAALKKA